MPITLYSNTYSWQLCVMTSWHSLIRVLAKCTLAVSHHPLQKPENSRCIKWLHSVASGIPPHRKWYARSGCGNIVYILPALGRSSFPVEDCLLEWYTWRRKEHSLSEYRTPSETSLSEYRTPSETSGYTPMKSSPAASLPSQELDGKSIGHVTYYIVMQPNNYKLTDH